MLGGEALVNGGRDAALQGHEWVCSETQPGAVLLPKTDAGSDLGPRLAARLGTGLAQDCTSVGLDPDGGLTATRPVYGGNAVARVSFGAGNTGVAIVRGKIYEALDADPSRTGEIIESSPQIDPARVRVRTLRRVEQEATGIRLEDAAVVVSGGRGLGGSGKSLVLLAGRRVRPRGHHDLRGALVLRRGRSRHLRGSLFPPRRGCRRRLSAEANGAMA